MDINAYKIYILKQSWNQALYKLRNKPIHRAPPCSFARYEVNTRLPHEAEHDEFWYEHNWHFHRLVWFFWLSGNSWSRWQSKSKIVLIQKKNSEDLFSVRHNLVGRLQKKTKIICLYQIKWIFKLETTCKSSAKKRQKRKLRLRGHEQQLFPRSGGQSQQKPRGLHRQHA